MRFCGQSHAPAALHPGKTLISEAGVLSSLCLSMVLLLDDDLLMIFQSIEMSECVGRGVIWRQNFLFCRFVPGKTPKS
jgi:hypothetical protein